MTTARDRLEQIKARHQVRVIPGRSRYAESVTTGPSTCRLCDMIHPCDASRLVAFTEAILGLVPSENPELIEAGYGVLASDILALADQHLGAPHE